MILEKKETSLKQYGQVGGSLKSVSLFDKGGFDFIGVSLLKKDVFGSERFFGGI